MLLILIFIIIISILIFFFGYLIEDQIDLDFNYNKLYFKNKIVDIETIEDYINFKEEFEQHLNFEDKKEIIWYDDKKEKTDIVVYFLHGFRATKREGTGVPQSIAKKAKANLLLARQPGVGVYNREDSFDNITFYNYLRNIYEDLILLSILGNKIILCGSSTGCTYNIIATTIFKQFNIYKNIFFSPNVGLHYIYNNILIYLSYGYGRALINITKNKFKLDDVVTDMNIVKPLISVTKIYNNLKIIFNNDFIAFISENDPLVLNKKVDLFFDNATSSVKHYYIFKNENIHPILTFRTKDVFLNKIDIFLKQKTNSIIKEKI